MKNASSLFATLRVLKGNQRACVIVEPLWAIPNNLITPFASLYMAAVGLGDAQIGLIASLGLLMQFLWGLFSGAIVDKYGRRGTMLVFGLLAWAIPCALWAMAQGYWYFFAAMFFNSMWQVTGNSFSCMIVEDGDSGQLMNTYAILNILGIAAGFVAPIAGLCIDRFTLVPTMRGLYLAAMVLMSVRFLLQYRLGYESGIGKRRMRECKGKSVVFLALGGWRAYLGALRRRLVLLCVVSAVLMTCVSTIQAAFWPLFVASAYGVSDSMMAAFPLVKTVVSLLVYFFITPRLKLHTVRAPLLCGIDAQALGLGALLICYQASFPVLGAVFLSAACEAISFAILGPLSESLMSVSLPSLDRARVISFILALVLLVSTPVGWIAGRLAEWDRALPLILNLVLLGAEAAVALGIARAVRSSASPANAD